MDFFKSVFSTDPDPDREQTDIDQQDKEHEAETETETSTSTESPVATWKNIGGLIKTIQSKSESVIQTYRKDLEEFSTGLKKETSVFKEVAAKVVNDLPGSLEAGASAATESLESVGQAIDEFGGSVWRGTNQIILQGKDAILSMDSDSNMSNFPEDASNLNSSSSFGKKYNRFEMQVLGIQNDESTYIEEVESENDYEKWRAGFSLEEKEEEIEELIYENEKLEGLFEKLVPDVIDKETFWCRYFYKVYKLKLAEDTRAKLVKRVIQGEEEEELTWSDDEDDDENENNKQDVEEKIKEDDRGNIIENSRPMKETGIEEAKQEDVTEGVRNLEVVEVEEPINESQVENVVVEQLSGGDESSAVQEEVPVESKSLERSETEEMTKDMKSEETTKDTNSEDKINVGTKSNETVHVGTESEEKIPVDSISNEMVPVDSISNEKVPVDSISNEKVPVDLKLEHVESDKARESDVVSTQPSIQMEVDNEWDELEDFGENEDKNVEKPNVSMKPVDLRKRLSVAEDDEDLTWDIEDEDD